MRTTLLTVAATAALALATLTGCDPGRRWVADGSGYSGPKIGLPGSENARHLVYCVREQDYDPNPASDSSYPPETPIREVEVSAAVADAIHGGDTCPDGPSVTAAALLATTACGAGLTSVTTTVATPSGSSAASPPITASAAWTQLGELQIAVRGTMDGYSREKFPHWANQGDNCNTRELVLNRDGKDVKAGKDCNPTAGTWHSIYDDATWTRPSDVDIDHMVPLAQGWVSGAKSWTTEKRAEFANDLTRPQLFAVTDHVNQEKSDKAPDQWKPPLVSFWCTYATDWIVVKHYYGLTITVPEKKALAEMLDRC